MGLDAAEIVMDTEDRFGISIQNTEAERIRTVGDLVSLIQSRIEAARVAHCPTLASFLQLRSCVREIANDDRLRIRTTTKVVDVLDPAQRRRLWKRVSKLLGAQLPSLRRPSWLRQVLVYSSIAMFILAVATAAVVDWEIWPLTLVIAFLLSLTLNLLTVRFRIVPPIADATFGALAKRMAGVTVATKQLHLQSFDAILAELTPIVVDTLGVDASEVIPSARFVEDLGVG